MAKASDYHKEGFNCAEAIIKAIAERKEIDIPVSLGSGLGSGMTVGSICGAVSGAAIAIGFIKGRNDIDEPNEARRYVRDFMNKIADKYGSYDCVQLKRKGVSCEEIIDFADEYLDEIK